MGKLTVTSFITLDNVVEDPHLWSGDVPERRHRRAQRRRPAARPTRCSSAASPTRASPRRGRRARATRSRTSSTRCPSTSCRRRSSGPTGTTRRSSATTWSSRSARCKEDQNLLVWGSPTLVQTLMDDDLVDEYVLLVSPIVRGDGHQALPATPARSTTCGSPRRRCSSGGMLALRMTPAAGRALAAAGRVAAARSRHALHAVRVSAADDPGRRRSSSSRR